MHHTATLITGQSYRISAGFKESTSSCLHTQGWKSGGTNLDHAAAKRFKIATDIVGLNSMTTHQGASIDRVRGFRTLQEAQRRDQWKAFTSVTRYDKTVICRPTAPRQAGNIRATCRGIIDKATASSAAHKRMIGKYMLDMFGGTARHEIRSQV